MNRIHPNIIAAASVLVVSHLLTGCAEAPPAKEAGSKSIQDIAQEAMSSTGKLSKEQINALIQANAACRPDDQH
ncbi:hypothetical protein VSS37_05575 [Candidatus Thiothrix sp. Deng01]|uniref:Lipoprotein n=1 Tax=Candidatus Thiothrix phosphatis TaxID=3112415 RepID=A0ABU6CUD5_9GAMM|nr:hypothetical protein [Candidatus Thiothrix sp. Deng01]MEB4590440.1 hypothetical protein [Candidatus Thiothrix sp. Deng01]